MHLTDRTDPTPLDRPAGGGTGAADTVPPVVLDHGGTGAADTLPSVVLGGGGTGAADTVPSVVLGGGGTGAADIVPPVVLGPFDVTAEAITAFADAIGDPAPAYRCAHAARALGHPDVIAPPTFAVRIAARAEAALLARQPLGHDFASAVHLAQEYRHLRPLYRGDVLTAHARLTESRRAMGGALVTVEATLRAADGTPVTVSTARILSRTPVPEDPPPSPQPPEALARLIGRDDFVCLGAQAALRRGTITHRSCGVLGSAAGAHATLDALRAFLTDFEPGDRSYASFVATFDALPDTAERTFEDALWRHLQHMHEKDTEDTPHHTWSDLHDADPASPRFAFSVAGHPFFVIGLHPGASRPSRRFERPALVFNSHLQFNAMGRTFFRMRKKIRERDLARNGSVNPSLLAYRDEARHYAGRLTEPDWVCPFTARPTAPPPTPGLGGRDLR